MASSRRSTNPHDRDGGSEPFPSFPESGSQPQHRQQDTHSTTTSTTTTTVFSGRNDPVITTSTAFPSSSTDPHPPPIITTDPNNAPVPFSQTTVTVPGSVRRRPIGIRRLPSGNRLSVGESDDGTPSRSGSGRRRSNSAPQDNRLLGVGGGGSTRLTRQSTREPALATLREEGSQPQPAQPQDSLHVPGQDTTQTGQTGASGVGRRRSVSNAARSIMSRLSNEDYDNPPHEYENDVVDYLDVIGMVFIARRRVR